ncbi:hypothetical protein D9M72_580340 [compost metagenome]
MDFAAEGTPVRVEATDMESRLFDMVFQKLLDAVIPAFAAFKSMAAVCSAVLSASLTVTSVTWMSPARVRLLAAPCGVSASRMALRASGSKV